MCCVKGHNTDNNANGVVHVWQRGEFLTMKDVIHCGLVPRLSEVISTNYLGQPGNEARYTVSRSTRCFNPERAFSCTKAEQV